MCADANRDGRFKTGHTESIYYNTSEKRPNFDRRKYGNRQEVKIRPRYCKNSYRAATGKFGGSSRRGSSRGGHRSEDRQNVSCSQYNSIDQFSGNDYAQNNVEEHGSKYSQKEFNNKNSKRRIWVRDFTEKQNVSSELNVPSLECHDYNVENGNKYVNQTPLSAEHTNSTCPTVSTKTEILTDGVKDKNTNTGANEKTGKSKKAEESSSTSDSDSSDSTNSELPDLKKAVNESLLKNKTEKQTVETPAKNNNEKTKKTLSKKSTDSSSSSDSDNPVTIKNLKRERNSEDEVVYLGKLQNFENLVDDSPEPANETCLLCDEEGHTSFSCLMVCKNCGEKYHGLKNCPKPANVSTVLQSFMEFCLTQFSQYNPEERFLFNHEIPHQVAKNLPETFNIDTINHAKRKSKNSTRSSPAPSRSSRKRTLISDTDSSSDESLATRRNTSRKKQYKSQTAPSTSFQSLPFNAPLPQGFPFAYNPQGLPYNPQGMQHNPLLSFAQMLGFNPMNFLNNSNTNP